MMRDPGSNFENNFRRYSIRLPGITMDLPSGGALVVAMTWYWVLGEGRLTPVGCQTWEPPSDRSSSVGVVTPGTPTELVGSDRPGPRGLSAAPVGQRATDHLV